MAVQIPKDKLTQEALTALLEEHCGIRVVKARRWMAASLADLEIAGHLGITHGDPVLLLEAHFLDELGRVIEVSIDKYRTDHIRHYAELRRAARGADS
jgi:DNA-binding GntR family transcriptional regulator